MSTKLAVLIIHGVGKQNKEHFKSMQAMETLLKDKFVDAIQGEVTQNQIPEDMLKIELVRWARILQTREDKLWEKMESTEVGRDLDVKGLRHVFIDFAGDAVAYQPLGKRDSEREIYDLIHAQLAAKLKELGKSAGPKAPLIVIGHSLGTIIASNYFYDLGRPENIGSVIKEAMGDSPLDMGETLTSLNTLGSPIAVWALRYDNFGRPLQIPSDKLWAHYPQEEFPELVAQAKWNNFFDKDDAAGWPLGPLYGDEIVKDIPVNVGPPLLNATPLSHTYYWKDRDVINPIVSTLANIWRAVNPTKPPHD